MAEQMEASTSTTNKPLLEKIDCHDWSQFNDHIFDIIDDNNDTMEYEEKELNRYFLEGHWKSMIDEEEMIDDDTTNEQDEEEEKEEEEEEKTVLSQKLSQLSTKDDKEDTTASDTTTITVDDTNKRRRQVTTTSSPNSMNTKKKLKMTSIDDDQDSDEDDDTIGKDKLPRYLLTTNQAFIHLIKIIHQTNSTIDINDTQAIAFMKHRIALLLIKKQITETSLASVTGKLPIFGCDLTDVHRRVWPMQARSLMLTYRKSSSVTTACTTAATMETNKENEQTICENLLQQQIKKIDQSVKQYEQQLHAKRNSVIGLTSEMEEMVDKYVQDYSIKPFKIKGDFKIRLMNYQYQSKLLERKYLQEQPNEYQTDIAKRLTDAMRQVEKSRRDLFELKQRLFYNKLSMASTLNTNIEPGFVVNEHDKMVYYTKLDLLAEQLIKVEEEYFLHQSDYDSNLSKMWDNHRQLVKEKGMPTTLLSLLQQRLSNIELQWKDISDFRIDYYLRNSYDTIDENNQHHHPEQSMSSNMILTTNQHGLTDKQLQLLNRGPTYIPLCQTYVSSSYPSIDDLVKKQFQPLKRELANFFPKYQKVTQEFQSKIEGQFKYLFTQSSPSDLQQERAIYEKKLIQSIRSTLKKNNLILRRTADNMNTFYLGNRQEFEVEADKYLKTTVAYEHLVTKEPKMHSNYSKEMIDSMNRSLEKLRKNKSLETGTVDKLRLDASQVKLPSIYFLPDVSKEDVLSLVPFMTSKQSATWKIGQFINRILRPYADRILQLITFRDEFDFIQKLNHYVSQERRLRPTTLFCSIKITNFSTLDTHKNMIETVGNFLEDYFDKKEFEKLTIPTMKRLLEIFLFNNTFCYKEQLYTFTKGSPTTMPLSETLSNIYLFIWQKKILNPVGQDNEFFGRYKDQIFFTWKKSNAFTLETFLREEIREKDLNVQFEYSIGTKVEFLNASVENEGGKLYTRVFHHPTTIQRYTLPYVSGHSKVSHSDWLRYALLRAICFCPFVEDFRQERMYLELTYLCNGYSLFFVESHMRHFFNYFHMANMRYSQSQSEYDKFRQLWFQSITMQRELTDELEKLDDNEHLIHLNYYYDFGPRCQFNQRFDDLWSEDFKGHPTLANDKIKVLLKAKHCYTSNGLLAIEK